MAKARSKGEIQLGRFDMTIDGDRYWDLSMKLTLAISFEEVMTQLTGDVPLARLSRGAVFIAVVDLAESTDTIRKKVLEIAASLPPAIGVELPTHLIEIHDQAAGATTTGDIVVPKASLCKIESNYNGKLLVPQVAITGLYDDTIDGAFKRRNA